MTAARRERKSRRPAGLWMAAAGMLLCSAGPFPAAIAAATSELVVVNRHTGLAIDGFDPVAYFVDSMPVPGRAELEIQSGGASWRFRNEGNRAAFLANPEIYMPQFGGHDPVALSRGAATAGNASLWLVARQRLYLFYSEEARTAFAADLDSAIAAAERHWPSVRRTLVP